MKCLFCMSMQIHRKRYVADHNKLLWYGITWYSKAGDGGGDTLPWVCDAKMHLVPDSMPLKKSARSNLSPLYG